MKESCSTYKNHHLNFVFNSSTTNCPTYIVYYTWPHKYSCMSGWWSYMYRVCMSLQALSNIQATIALVHLISPNDLVWLFKEKIRCFAAAKRCHFTAHAEAC